MYKDVLDFNNDFSDYHFNLEELKRYVKFYVKILSRGSELPKQTILRSDMIACTKEMFSDLDEDSQLPEFKIQKRLCPDMEKIKDDLKVKNSYSNKKERVSFSIQAVLCDQPNENCADPEKIDQFLKDIFFTSYILEENVEFGDISNIGKRPISVNDKFHSQFMLSS